MKLSNSWCEVQYEGSQLFNDREAGEIIRLLASVHLSVWVCETYVVHHVMGTGLCCAPPTCIVHLPAMQLIKIWKNVYPLILEIYHLNT